MQASTVVQCQECNPQFVLNLMRIVSNVSSAFGKNIKLQNLGYLPETEKGRFTVKAVSLHYASAGPKWHVNINDYFEEKKKRQLLISVLEQSIPASSYY